MSPYNIVIIDDEEMAREIIETHVSKFDEFKIIASCKNAIEGFSVIGSNPIDIIFLDINMPEISGLQFAKSITQDIQIIFTTAYREYAVEGFEVNALDYLLKPISLERMAAALKKFKDLKLTQTHQKDLNFTFFRCERKMVRVDFDAIQYVESFGDYLKIHTLSNTLVTRETLTKVLTKLPENKFLRIHRSTIVAISKIETYTNEYVVIDGKAISVSRSYRNSMLATLDKI